MPIAVGIHNTAPDAWPRGTRVAKCKTESGDTHQDGALATVMGSVLLENGRIGYCLEWDDMPGLPVWTVDFRITKAKQQPEGEL